MFTRALFLFLFSFVSIVSNADTVSYEFDIVTKQMNFTGNIVEALAIDDRSGMVAGCFRPSHSPVDGGAFACDANGTRGLCAE